MYNLFRRKIIIAALLVTSGIAHAQEAFQPNLPYSDAKWLHYGFSIGLHTSSFKLSYSDAFVTPAFDSLHSIMPKPAFGFSLGFITDFRLHDQFNLRVLPRVAFSEYRTDINFTNGESIEEVIEATYVEFPILLKYKSQRHRNFRMYVVGGIVPSIEASGKKRKERSDNLIQVSEGNLSLEFGMGFDMYYPLFKFSPEIRFSKGLVNVLKEDEAGNSDSIKSLSTNTFSIFFQFSD